MNTNMTSLETGNPYNAPRSVNTTWLTRKGYSPAHCLVLFFVVGWLMGLVSGAITYVMNSINASILLHLLPTSVALSLSLWLGVGRFIRRTPAHMRVLMILSCILSVAITAVVYVQILQAAAFPLNLLKACLFAPAIGGFLITASLRLTSGKTPIRVHLIAWLSTWTCGAIAFFVVEELGARRRMFYEPALAFICTTTFVSVVVALIGWQLAEADCEQNRMKSPARD